VSSGPKLIVVPDVRGKTRKVAAEMLQTAGFKSKFTEAFSADVEKGQVSDQTPLGGESLAEGGTVNVVISKGVDLVKVPNLKLMSQSQAEAALKDAGLKRGSVTTRVTTQRDPGTVLDMSPGAGQMVPRGSSVNIVVAAAPATIAMPRLIGLTATEANAKLAQLGLSATSTEQESSEPAGTVIGQDPPVGRQIDPTNVAINIVVSTGPPPTTSTP
jgi:serine/threonine-protein kinase